MTTHLVTRTDFKLGAISTPDPELASVLETTRGPALVIDHTPAIYIEKVDKQIGWFKILSSVQLF